MADDLKLTDVEREAAQQLVQLSEGETTTNTSAAASATSSSSSCGSVTFNRAEKNNNSIFDNVGFDNDEEKRAIKKEKNQKRIIDREFNHDEDGEEEICNLMRSTIRKRYRSIIDIYKATTPLIN